MEQSQSSRSNPTPHCYLLFQLVTSAPRWNRVVTQTHIIHTHSLSTYTHTHTHINHFMVLVVSTGHWGNGFYTHIPLSQPAAHCHGNRKPIERVNCLSPMWRFSYDEICTFKIVRCSKLQEFTPSLNVYIYVCALASFCFCSHLYFLCLWETSGWHGVEGEPEQEWEWVWGGKSKSYCLHGCSWKFSIFLNNKTAIINLCWVHPERLSKLGGIAVIAALPTHIFTLKHMQTRGIINCTWIVCECETQYNWIY